MSETRGTVKAWAKSVFESGITKAFVTDANWNDICDRAQRQICADTQCRRETFTVVSVADQAEYAWPDRLLEAREVWWKDFGTQLAEYSEDEMIECFGNWRGAASGTPARYVWNGIEATGRLTLHPAPGVDGTKILVRGYSVPANLANDAATIELRAPYDELLVWKMVMMACELNTDDPDVLRKLAYYEGRYGEKARELKARNHWPYERRVIKGEARREPERGWPTFQVNI